MDQTKWLQDALNQGTDQLGQLQLKDDQTARMNETPPRRATSLPASDLAETERSAELLRLALPMITRHGRGFAPVSYAVWFELRAELDEVVAKKERISESLTYDIYQRHVVDRIEKSMRDSRAGLLDLMKRVDESVQNATVSAASFDDRLETFSDSLTDDAAPQVVRTQVSTLRADVQAVNSRMRSLQEHLEGTRGEVQRLAEELAQAREEAQLDPLSGLLNRRGFDSALAAQIAAIRSNGEDLTKPLTLVIVDIDHFKNVNDTHGHLFGDKVIQGVGKILDGAIMRKDFVSRFGGEEFAIILPDTNEAGGIAVAERVRQAVSQSRIRRAKSSEVVTNITVSAGVSTFVAGDSAASLIERADQALYRAKNGGRNRVVGAADLD